jgi:hypothetical protein
MGDGMDEGIDGPPYFRSACDRIPMDHADAAEAFIDAGRRRTDPMAGLDRITALAAYRLLSGAHLPDALTLDAVDRIPVEPPEGYVLKFEKTFGGSRTYTYVALRAGDAWYLTGNPGRRISWVELKEFIHDNPCWIATAWAEVPPVEASPFDDLTPAEWHATMWPRSATVEGSTEKS